MPEKWTLYLTIWGATAQTLFILIYAFRPWWRAFVGQALFTKSLALAVLLDIAVVNKALDYRHEDLVFDVLYAGVVGGITFQLVALIVEGRSDHTRGRPRADDF